MARHGGCLATPHEGPAKSLQLPNDVTQFTHGSRNLNAFVQMRIVFTEIDNSVQKYADAVLLPHL